jgi:hypothetical protein
MHVGFIKGITSVVVGINLGNPPYILYMIDRMDLHPTSNIIMHKHVILKTMEVFSTMTLWLSLAQGHVISIKYTWKAQQ